MIASNIHIPDTASVNSVLERVKAQYYYDRNDEVYWYPLNVNELPFDEENALYIDKTIMMHKLDDIKKLYGVSDGIYCILAYWIKDKYVLEINDLDFTYMHRNVCVEYFCVTKDFTSVIYVSHEGTVTFAGEKLDAVKAILEPLRHEWNVYHGG